MLSSTKKKSSEKNLREIRKENIKKRKNFLPLVILITLLLFALIVIVFNFNPYNLYSIVIFLILFFGLSFLTLSLVFLDKYIGIIISVSLTFFVFLRYLGLGHFLNFLLLTAFTVSVIFYRIRK